MKILNNNPVAIKYLTQEEVARIFAQVAGKRNQAMFNMMYKYGLRASEVGLITIKDVDFKRRRIKIYRLKGGVSGEYAMFSDVESLLKIYLKERNNDSYIPLFLSRNKNPISRKRIHELFREFGDLAGLPKRKQHSHTLRHSIAVHMLDAGLSQEEVKHHLGHRYIKSTDVYAAISGRKRQQIHESMEQGMEIVRWFGS